jgi:hypothetical protein
VPWSSNTRPVTIRKSECSAGVHDRGIIVKFINTFLSGARRPSVATRKLSDEESAVRRC